jgi:hypothetical protein
MIPKLFLLIEGMSSNIQHPTSNTSTTKERQNLTFPVEFNLAVWPPLQVQVLSIECAPPRAAVSHD